MNAALAAEPRWRRKGEMPRSRPHFAAVNELTRRRTSLESSESKKHNESSFASN